MRKVFALTIQICINAKALLNCNPHSHLTTLSLLSNTVATTQHIATGRWRGIFILLVWGIVERQFLLFLSLFASSVVFYVLGALLPPFFSSSERLKRSARATKFTWGPTIKARGHPTTEHKS